MQVGGWQGPGGVRQAGRQAGSDSSRAERGGEGAVSGSEERASVGVVVVLGVMWDGSLARVECSRPLWTTA